MLVQHWRPDITTPTMDLVRACYSNQVQLAFCYWSPKTRQATPVRVLSAELVLLAMNGLNVPIA